MRRSLAVVGIVLLLLASLSQAVHAEEPDEPRSAPDSTVFVDEGASASEPSDPTEPLPPLPPPNPSGPSDDGGASIILDWLAKLDPRKWAADFLDALLTTIGRALLEAVRGFLDWAMGLGGSSLNFVTRTPPEGTYASPTVQGLWAFSRALANALLALVAMWGGFNVIVKEHLRSPYHEALELLPRLILAALAANLSLELARLLIEANNAVSGAVGQVGLPGYDQATPTQEGVALILVALVYGVVAILLVLQMLMRLALIDVLIVLAPVVALLWVLPQTQGWSRWWGSLFPITVFQQAVQMMVLRMGSALMVELTPGSLSDALLTLLLGIAVCWLTLKVPALLRGQVGQAGLWNVASLVLVSRLVGRAGGGSRAGSPQGAGSQQPAPSGASQ